MTFATLHVVGSNNNRSTVARPSTGNEEEYRARNTANLEWLSETFVSAEASGSPGVMLVMQANIFEEDTNRPSGFAEFKAALAEETAAFDGPVVLVHGDTHTFRIDKPLSDPGTGAPLPNFTCIETFGSPNVYWVRASVDARNPEVFSFRPELVNENLAP